MLALRGGDGDSHGEDRSTTLPSSPERSGSALGGAYLSDVASVSEPLLQPPMGQKLTSLALSAYLPPWSFLRMRPDNEDDVYRLIELAETTAASPHSTTNLICHTREHPMPDGALSLPLSRTRTLESG